MRAAVKTPSLEDLQAQIEAQDTELARLKELIEELPPSAAIPASALAQLEEACELPPTFATTTYGLPNYALRV